MVCQSKARKRRQKLLLLSRDLGQDQDQSVTPKGPGLGQTKQACRPFDVVPQEEYHGLTSGVDMILNNPTCSAPSLKDLLPADFALPFDYGAYTPLRTFSEKKIEWPQSSSPSPQPSLNGGLGVLAPNRIPDMSGVHEPQIPWGDIMLQDDDFGRLESLDMGRDSTDRRTQ